MTSKQKFITTIAFLWLWDSALGSPVISRLVSITLFEILVEVGIISTGSIERILVAALLTLIGIAVWMKKKNGRGRHFDKDNNRPVKPNYQYYSSCRKDSPAPDTVDIKQNKVTSRDLIGKGALKTRHLTSSARDGCGFEIRSNHNELCGAGAMPPTQTEHSKDDSPQSPSLHTIIDDDAE